MHCQLDIWLLTSFFLLQADAGSLADTHAGSGDDSGGGGGGPPRIRSVKSKPRRSRMHTEGSAADGDHDMPGVLTSVVSARIQSYLTQIHQ